MLNFDTLMMMRVAPLAHLSRFVNVSEVVKQAELSYMQSRMCRCHVNSLDCIERDFLNRHAQPLWGRECSDRVAVCSLCVVILFFSAVLFISLRRVPHCVSNDAIFHADISAISASCSVEW